MSAIEVHVKKEMLGDDPEIETYHVSVSRDGGVWTERYTRSDLHVFLRGVQAGASLSSGGAVHVALPDVPS